MVGRPNTNMSNQLSDVPSLGSIQITLHNQKRLHFSHFSHFIIIQNSKPQQGMVRIRNKNIFIFQNVLVLYIYGDILDPRLTFLCLKLSSMSFDYAMAMKNHFGSAVFLITLVQKVKSIEKIYKSNAMTNFYSIVMF